jgi:hypothetical protein
MDQFLVELKANSLQYVAATDVPNARRSGGAKTLLREF